MKALAAAMDGKYQEAYPIFEKQGGINQAILLLSMKQNSKAWEVLKKIEDTSPDTEYVKAIAANRLNNVNEAVIHLRNAITQNIFKGNSTKRWRCVRFTGFIRFR